MEKIREELKEEWVREDEILEAEILRTNRKKRR